MKRQPLFWFYLFVCYILLQFVWWSILFLRLISEANLSTEEYNSKFWMLFGEGIVFFIILFLVFIQVRKTFKKERDLNHLQKNFLLSVSHELKTPIASAKINLQALQKHDIQGEKKNEIVSNSISDINRLNLLVEKILLASKLEKKSFDFYQETINVNSLFNSRLDYWKQAYPDRINTDLKVNEEVAIDPIAITSIFDNLVENALKYSDDKIAVTVDFYQNSLVIAIQDNGLGIPIDEQNTIFKMFYRSENEEIRKNKGSGLGLYIVKQLVDALKGTIDLKSNQSGSTFTVKIPINKVIV